MIFVTGGTGFLGRHLVPALCRAGYPMRVLTRNPEANAWLRRYPNVEIVHGDLRTGEGLSAVEGCDYVVHAAGLFSMWQHAGDFDQTNVDGTERLLAASVQAGVKRFIYVSTIAVIGNPQPDLIIDEQHPPRPDDLYQASKLKAEMAVNRYNSSGEIDTIILRAGAFYGPLGDYAFNRLFFTDPLRGIIMQMDGGHYLIFPVYIADVAATVVQALLRGKSGSTYNITGAPISHRAAFDIICREASIRWPRLNLPGFIGISVSRFLNLLSRITGREPFWPLGLRSYVFNNWLVSADKAKSELGFNPVDFCEGAKLTLAWYRDGRPEWLAELDCPRS